MSFCDDNVAALNGAGQVGPLNRHIAEVHCNTAAHQRDSCNAVVIAPVRLRGVASADHIAVSRGEHIRAVSVLVVESCTTAFVAESTLTDLRNVECKLFRNGPAMSRVKRSSPTRIPNAS